MIALWVLMWKQKCVVLWPPYTQFLKICHNKCHISNSKMQRITLELIEFHDHSFDIEVDRMISLVSLHTDASIKCISFFTRMNTWMNYKNKINTTINMISTIKTIKLFLCQTFVYTILLTQNKSMHHPTHVPMSRWKMCWMFVKKQSDHSKDSNFFKMNISDSIIYVKKNYDSSLWWEKFSFSDSTQAFVRWPYTFLV